MSYTARVEKWVAEARAREKHYATLLAQGWTQSDIARTEGITRQRVFQIVKRMRERV